MMQDLEYLLEPCRYVLIGALKFWRFGFREQVRVYKQPGVDVNNGVEGSSRKRFRFVQIEVA